MFADVTDDFININATSSYSFVPFRGRLQEKFRSRFHVNTAEQVLSSHGNWSEQRYTQNLVKLVKY